MEEKTNFINSININADTDFPYLVLDAIEDRSYPRTSGFHVMHWHEDLQFIYVLNGEIELRTLDSTVTFRAGDGVFINKNVVHLIKNHSACHYNSFIFPDYFVKFYFGSPAKAFVDSVTENKQIQFCSFTQGINWCDQVLSILAKMSLLEKNKTEFYIYEVLVLVSALWLEMRKNMLVQPQRQGNAVSIRMQKFLRYIEAHYQEDLTLDNLAESANVSKSECLRCFKVSMQTTPYKYLMEFRLSKAADLLRRSKDPIGDIAANVGFHQMSHFGKCFKEKTGCTPKQYRAGERKGE